MDPTSTLLRLLAVLERETAPIHLAGEPTPASTLHPCSVHPAWCSSCAHTVKTCKNPRRSEGAPGEEATRVLTLTQLGGNCLETSQYLPWSHPLPSSAPSGILAQQGGKRGEASSWAQVTARTELCTPYCIHVPLRTGQFPSGVTIVPGHHLLCQPMPPPPGAQPGLTGWRSRVARRA